MSNLQGDSVTDSQTLAAGASAVVPVTNARGKTSFARHLAIKNTGAGDLSISYGNGALCKPIPVAAGTGYDTTGPITMYRVSSTAGTTYSISLKVA